MAFAGKNSSYEDGDEAQVPYVEKWGNQTSEGRQTALYALRSLAIEEYGDRLPNKGRVERYELTTDDQRELWDAMSALLSAADELEGR